MTSKNQKEVLGIFITKQNVGNMNIEHIHVSDFAIQTILKTVQLSQKTQFEVVDKLVDRTPDWLSHEEEDRMVKIKAALIQETVVEYLRLTEEIREDVDMLEIGIDKEGSIIVSAYYIDKSQIPKEIIEKNKMTHEKVEQLEREINILNGSINIYEEAKKKLEQMKKDNVVSLPNRAARRQRKKK